MLPWWSHYFLSTLTVLLTLLFVSTILRSKRAAGSTIAWLIVICTVPYFGIPLYLFLTDRKFKNHWNRKKKLYELPTTLGTDEALPSAERILLSCGAPPVRSNSQLDLLPTGEEAWTSIMSLIANAKESIFITTFIFGDDKVGNAVVDALTKKAESGIDVRVIVDSLGATLLRHPSFKRLTKAGGKVAYFMPVFHLPFQGRSNLRNHRKLMVVDREFAVLGGMNLAKEYLGPDKDPKRWVDLGVLIKGESVTDVHEVFLQDWAYATRAPRPTAHPAKFAPTLTSLKEKLTQIVASGPDIHGDPLYDVLLNSIYCARENIWIVTPYFIPDESLTKALDLASKRGVTIHVILPSHSNHILADFARGSFIRELDAAGVRFYLHPKMIHAKAVLMDRSLGILGSANFDMRSLLLNYELGLLLYSEENIDAVEKWVWERQRESALSIPRTGFFREILEGVGRVLGPIL